MPRQDYDFLYEAGVKGIYGPGTPIPASAKDVLEQIRKARLARLSSAGRTMPCSDRLGIARGGRARRRAAAQRRAIAKAITLLESTRADHRARADALLTALLPHTGQSLRLGISGVPASASRPSSRRSACG